MKFEFMGTKDVCKPKPCCPVCGAPNPKVTRVGFNYLCVKCNHLFKKPEKYYVYRCEKHGLMTFDKQVTECPLCAEEGEQ